MEYKFVDIRQRQYRKFLIALKRYQPEEWENIDDLPMEVYMDMLVRAAIEAEWFEEPPDLDEMRPKDVPDVAMAVAEIYSEARTPDPN